jgi:glyoxylate/hydroxypyruvate reductase A
MKIIIKPDLDREDVWIEAFGAAAPELECVVWDAAVDPASIDYAFVWNQGDGALRRFTNLKCIFSLGAGVDHLLCDPELPAGVPIVRMVEPELTRGMSEYVALHVLRFHREGPVLDEQQRARIWNELLTPTAPGRRVGFLGFGVLAKACARVLSGFDFDLACWSRNPKAVAGIESFHGPEGLVAFLARTEILVCLLPLTPQTTGILDQALFAGLPRGAWLINAGRGGHQVEADILAALESGQLAGAALDVFQSEPLPADHPFWPHPKITISPHIASVTQPRSAAREIVANIRRLQAGEAPHNIVDTAAGY